MQESKILEKLLSFGRKVIPKNIFRSAQPAYHYLLAIIGAIIYRFPAKKLIVIGVTGTKGKSTTVELVNSILETAGKKTALANTIRYKIGDKDWPNMFKMSLRGRFFTQRFLRKALNAGCAYAIIEISSEGVKQYRHKFLYLDALIFTNLAPEHIESHGSYENYVKAKLEIAKELQGQKKRPLRKVLGSPLQSSTRLSSQVSFSGPAIIVNKDDKEAEKFLALNIENKIEFSLSDWQSKNINLNIPGEFNIYNALGAASCAQYFGISEEDIKKGLESVKKIRGRAEKIEEGQSFEVIVDYAHTPESLKAIYETFKDKKIIGILGNTGGGRDRWKRKVMAEIADRYCSLIILTNEDPYDEDPEAIVEEMKQYIKNKPVEIIMDRRVAIRRAISAAKSGDAILITGKGTDPYIMEANGRKTPWDDATVAREELREELKKIMNNNA